MKRFLLVAIFVDSRRLLFLLYYTFSIVNAPAHTDKTSTFSECYVCIARRYTFGYQQGVFLYQTVRMMATIYYLNIVTAVRLLHASKCMLLMESYRVQYSSFSEMFSKGCWILTNTLYHHLNHILIFPITLFS